MKTLLGILLAPIAAIAGIKLAMHPDKYRTVGKRRRGRRGRRRRRW